MKLAYTALSPYCRKVRMAMEYKGLAFEIVTADHVTEVPAFNPRAEVPVLIDGDTVVCQFAGHPRLRRSQVSARSRCIPPTRASTRRCASGSASRIRRSIRS